MLFLNFICDVSIYRLKLFNQNNKPFVSTYLEEQWFFNFDLTSKFSEEKDDFIKHKFDEDCKMCQKFLEKVTKLSEIQFMSKPKIAQSVLKKIFSNFLYFTLKINSLKYIDLEKC